MIKLNPALLQRRNCFVKLGTCAIIRKDDKFLLSKRALYKKDGSERIGGGKWSFLGGKVEFKETPFDCIIRETKEESGLSINNCLYLGCFEKDDYIDFVFEVNDFNGELVCAENEIDEFKWVTIEELKQLDLWDYSKTALFVYEDIILNRKTKTNE